MNECKRLDYQSKTFPSEWIRHFGRSLTTTQLLSVASLMMGENGTLTVAACTNSWTTAAGGVGCARRRATRCWKPSRRSGAFRSETNRLSPANRKNAKFTKGRSLPMPTLELWMGFETRVTDTFVTGGFFSALFAGLLTLSKIQRGFYLFYCFFTSTQRNNNIFTVRKRELQSSKKINEKCRKIIIFQAFLKDFSR